MVDVQDKRLIDVLLVEDDPTDAFLTRQALGAASLFRITHVSRLREALKVLGEQTMSVVLLDLGLPDSQGVETLAALRRQVPDTPVIVLTSNGDDELAVLSAQEGAQEYLVKSEPSDRSLRRAIRYVLERDRFEKALRERKQRLRAIINATPSCIKVVSPDGTVLEVNAAGVRMLEAAEPADVIGRSVFPWIAPEFLEVYQLFHQTVCQGRASSLAFDIVGRQGGRRSLESVAVPLSSPDGATSCLAITQDVTERKTTDAALRRTSELLRAVADGTADAVFVKDLQGRYLFFNPAAARFVGRNAEDILGLDDRALFDHDSAQQIMEVDRRIMESGSSEVGEHELTVAGVTRTFLSTKTPYRDDRGRVIGLIGISRDISERKRLEAARDRVAARLRLQVDRMPLACILFDAEFRIVEWNPAAETIFGYRKDEVLNMGPPFEKILPPHAWPIGRDILDRIRAGDMAAHALNDNLTRDGRIITCEWHNTPLFDENGEFQGLLALAQDVTQRRRDELDLTLRDRAIQAVSQGIIITDPTQPDNPVIYASPGFERMTGYAQAEVLGKNCRFLQGPDTQRETVARVRRAVANEEACAVEMLNYRRDGAPFWVELFISPVRDGQGRLAHFVGVQADITERRALEHQLHQSQKMEAVGQLAGGVAHDFNNLLTIILGSCDILQSTESVADSDLVVIDDIIEAAERAASLTRQLLTFSRKQLLEPVVLNVNDIVSSLNKMLLRLIREDIELSCSLAPDIWPLRADRGQIEQAIVNLAVNARDAMPDGGKLTIETRNLACSAEECRDCIPDCRPGRHVAIVVSDTGSGISPEIKARIFEPFFTTKAAGKGTGLGLAVVHGIVKQSDGCIAVSSEVGRGTSVRLYFPAVDDWAPSASVHDDCQPEKHGKETVLLVEDEEGVRALARLVLEKQGYAVLEASNGQRAIQVAENHQGALNLIITDMVMPVMGGRALVERLLPSRPALKVLLMSGYVNDFVESEGLSHGSHAFLQKPFSPSGLLRKVRLVLDANRPEMAGR